MKNFLILLSILVLNGSLAFAQDKEIYFTQSWEMDGFEKPESIVIDEKHQVLYISNINGELTEKDGNGYISKVSLDGTLIAKKWIQGLNAPKGLAVYKNHLYVADIDEIIDVDIERGEVLQHFKAEKATFLNDVAVDKKGRVFVSNTFGISCIFKLENNVVSNWFETENLPMPNGLLAVKDGLLVVNYGVGLNPTDFSTKTPGSVYKISFSTQNLDQVTKPFGNLDGIASTVHGYVITDWLAGKVFYWRKDSVKEILNLTSGTADLTFDKSSKTMFIPSMKDGKVIAYKMNIKK